MVWSSKSHITFTVVLVCAELPKPEGRDVIVVLVGAREQLTPECQKRPSGCGVWGSSEGFFENTEKQRKLITTCTMTFTIGQRVMCSRTRECWWNTSTKRKLRNNVLSFLGRQYSVEFKWYNCKAELVEKSTMIMWLRKEGHTVVIWL